MKKIINGKKYDTETAQSCGSYWNGLSYNDFNYYKETLYKKKTGEFFLHGDGGANSKYSSRCGNSGYCGDEKIIPLTENEAKKWAEKYLDVDEYEAIFGEVEE